MNGLCPETPIIQVTGGSVQVQCSPAPAAPSNVQARLIDWLSTTGIVHVTWNDNSGNETGFTVERSADAGMNFQPIGTTEAGAGGPNGGFVDWVGLGTYVYRVRAIGTLGESAGANSPPITIGPTSPPTLTGTLVSATRIDLSWTALTNATAAILYRSADGGAFTELMALTLPANGFSDTTTAQNHTYAYRLDVSNPLGVSSSNVVVIGTAVPPAPTDVWTTVPSQTSAQVNWTYTLGTELGFRIQRAAGTGAFSAAQTLLPGARSYLDGGRASGRALRDRLWAFNNVGDGPFIEVSLNMAVPAAPTGAAADILSASQVRIRWTDTSLNENDFIISRQVNGGTEQDLRPGRPPGLKSSSTRASAWARVTRSCPIEQRLRFLDDQGPRSRRHADLHAGPGGQPGRRRGRPTGGREPDLDQRICQRLGDPSERTAVGAPTPAVFPLALGATSYNDATAVVGTTYDYRVVLENVLGTSASTVQVAFAAPPAPTNLSGTVVSGTQVNLTWEFTGTQHQRFRIERAVGAAAFAQLTEPVASARSYNNTGAPSSSALRYRIVAINGVGTGAPSNEFATSTAVPTAPTGVLAKVMSQNQVNVTWTDEATTEQNYRVERSTNGNSWHTAVDALPANTTSAPVTGLQPNNGYHFRVVAYNGAGAGTSTEDLTRTAVVGTTAPSGLTATAQGPARVRLAWTWNPTIPNENGFEVQRRPIGTTTWATIATSERKTRAFDDNTVEAGVGYQYQVRAFNGISPPSNFSNIASSTTPSDCSGAINGDACNDGNACTTVDTCQAGVCVGGSPRICQAGSACSTFTCDPADGICKPANRPLGTPCDDSSLCSTGDVCNGLGACGGTPKVCNDGNACTADSCVAATGQCQNTASSCSVTPLGACTMAGAAGSPPVAVFGYVNGEATNTEMVHGPNNQLTPVKLQGRQPRWFKPGTHENAFSLPIEAGQTINWTLGSQTVEASAATAACAGSRALAAREQLLLDPLLTTSSLVATEDLGGGQTVGGIAGDLDVTHTGDAHYEIPLDVPAGRLGVQPSLSLVYSSSLSKADGVMGTGWMLQGLSRIHRCPRTVVQDRTPNSITYSNGDAYCIDGQRLAPFQSLADGRVEYRTEKDSYARIVASAPESAGPRVFTVRTADGKVLTYGFPTSDDPIANARLADLMARYATFAFAMGSPTPENPRYEELGQAPTNRLTSAYYDHNHMVFYDWPLTESADRFGNNMRISYLATRGPVEVATSISVCPTRSRTPTIRRWPAGGR